MELDRDHAEGVVLSIRTEELSLACVFGGVPHWKVKVCTSSGVAECLFPLFFQGWARVFDPVTVMLANWCGIAAWECRCHHCGDCKGVCRIPTPIEFESCQRQQRGRTSSGVLSWETCLLFIPSEVFTSPFQTQLSYPHARQILAEEEHVLAAKSLKLKSVAVSRHQALLPSHMQFTHAAICTDSSQRSRQDQSRQSLSCFDRLREPNHWMAGMRGGREGG